MISAVIQNKTPNISKVNKPLISFSAYNVSIDTNSDSFENNNTTSKKVKKGILGAAGISAFIFGADLFLAKGKAINKLTRGKVSFIKTMSEEIDNVLKQDAYATKGRVEAFFGVPGLHAVWNHRISHKLHQWNIPVLPRLISNVSRFLTGTEIHPGAELGKNIFFDHSGAIVGETAKIGNNVTIIGRTVLGSTGKGGFLRHTIVEDGVTIGINTTFLGRITVGKNSQIGAGAVVTHSVPRGATVVGNPAKIIALDGQKLVKPAPLNSNSFNEFNKSGEA